jgi:hypothetical protein
VRPLWRIIQYRVLEIARQRADDLYAGYRYQFLDYMHADLGVAVRNQTGILLCRMVILLLSR